MLLYLIQTDNICIPSSVITQKANIGSFAANSGSNSTTSAEGSDDECIETNGKLFDAGSFRSFYVPRSYYYLRLDAMLLGLCCIVFLFPHDSIVHDLSAPFLLC